MADVNISTLSGILKDTWRFGIPHEMYTKSSPLFGMVAKVRDWSGATLTVSGKQLVYNYGLRSDLPATGASTYGGAFGTSGNTGNDEVKATPNRYYSYLNINHDAIDFGVAPEALIEVKALESEGQVKRTLNVISKEFFANGGGVIGKINGVPGTPGTGAALNVQGNTVPLQLQNIRDFLNFNKGDKIQFASTNGLSGAVNPVIRTLLKTPQSNGQLKLDVDLLAADAVLDTDYVFIAGRFGIAFKGLFAWCPTTAADLSTNFFNLDQTDGKRGGHRINLKKGGDEFGKLLQVLKQAEVVSADLDCLGVTPDFMDGLLQSSRYHQLVRLEGSQRRSNPLEQEYARMTKKERVIDSMPAGKMRYGVDGICIRWPAANKDVYVYSEKFLSQSEVSAEADDIIVGFQMSDVKFALPKKNGWDWQDHDTVGMFRQKEGDDSVYAMYAVRGQLTHLDPNNLIVAGSNVVE